MRKGEPGYPLVGSINKFSDGYGIGARYLTSRNQPTFPATIPQYRHLPPSEEFLAKSTCTKLIRDDERAMRRNADQIVLQTSGDYGKYHIDTESSVVRLNMKESRPHPGRFSMDSTANHQNHHHNESWKPADSRGTMSMSLNDVDKSFQDIKTPIPLSYRSQSNNTARGYTARPEDTLTSREKGKYLSTFSHLDSAFDKFSQRDLLAASLPTRAEVEQRRCVITNHHCAQKSGDWGRSLRRERGVGGPAAPAAASGGGGGGD